MEALPHLYLYLYHPGLPVWLEQVMAAKLSHWPSKLGEAPAQLDRVASKPSQ